MPCEDLDHELDQRAEDADDGKTDGKRRKRNGKAKYVTIKNWVTGDCAVMEDSDIMNERTILLRD